LQPLQTNILTFLPFKGLTKKQNIIPGINNIIPEEKYFQFSDLSWLKMIYG